MSSSGDEIFFKNFFDTIKDQNNTINKQNELMSQSLKIYAERKKGDNIILKGDFSQSIINIKSDIKNTSQSINILPNDRIMLHNMLEDLIKQLHETSSALALKQLPKNKVEELDAITQIVNELNIQTVKEKQNKILIKQYCNSLNIMIVNVASSFPSIVKIVVQIQEIIEMIT